MNILRKTLFLCSIFLHSGLILSMELSTSKDMPMEEAATPSIEEITLFMNAAFEGDLETVKYFVENFPTFVNVIDTQSFSFQNGTALLAAADSAFFADNWHCFAILEYLHSHQANPNLERIFHRKSYTVADIIKEGCEIHLKKCEGDFKWMVEAKKWCQRLGISLAMFSQSRSKRTEELPDNQMETKTQRTSPDQ